MKSLLFSIALGSTSFAYAQTGDTSFVFSDSLKLTFHKTQQNGQTLYSLDKSQLQMTLIEMRYLIKTDSLHHSFQQLHTKGEQYCDSIIEEKNLRLLKELNYQKQLKKGMVGLQEVNEMYKEKLAACTEDLSNCNKDLKKERSWFASKFMTYLKGAIVGAAAGVVVGVVVAKQ